MTKQEPLVSVLMTAYNREKYIAEAIESVLDSTYQNFELIIVDDRSKDNTVAIAESYAARDNRIHVYVNEQNLGDYPNRNKAASYAKGKYIKYVDSDDKLYPHGLDIMVYSMEKFPEAAMGVCNSGYHKAMMPVCLSPVESYRFHFLESSIFHRSPLSLIFRRDIFITNSGFNNERMVSDYEISLRLAMKYNIVILIDGVGWNRIHEGQEVNDSHKYYERYDEIARHYMEESGLLTATEQKIARKRTKNTFLKMLARKILAQ